MKYGFIGAGNIATAIITGAVSSGKISAGDIGIYDTNSTASDTLSKSTEVISHVSSAEIVRDAEIIFFAVKPHILPKVLEHFKQYLITRQDVPTIVSIAAGVTLEELASYTDNKLPLMRVMPNLNSTICAGLTAYCCNGIDGKRREVIEFLEASGGVVELDESMFSIFSVLGGSTPAFTYLFIESLAKSAHKLGMNKQQAIQIAARSVMGSAKMLAQSGEHPWALIDKVCSPGGLTIEGICALHDGGFESTVINALESAILKDSRLK